MACFPPHYCNISRQAKSKVIRGPPWHAGPGLGICGLYSTSKVFSVLESLHLYILSCPTVSV